MPSLLSPKGRRERKGLIQTKMISIMKMMKKLKVMDRKNC
jgi:hypothetical protein